MAEYCSICLNNKNPSKGGFFIFALKRLDKRQVTYPGKLYYKNQSIYDIILNNSYICYISTRLVNNIYYIGI